MGLMNIWWELFNRKSKPFRTRRIASLLFVKAHEDSVTSRQGPSHLFPGWLCVDVSGRRLFTQQQIGRLWPYVRCCQHYMQPNWITLSVTQLLFQGQYTEVPHNVQVISYSMVPCEKAISELNHTPQHEISIMALRVMLQRHFSDCTSSLSCF